MDPTASASTICILKRIHKFKRDLNACSARLLHTSFRLTLTSVPLAAGASSIPVFESLLKVLEVTLLNSFQEYLGDLWAGQGRTGQTHTRHQAANKEQLRVAALGLFPHIPPSAVGEAMHWGGSCLPAHFSTQSWEREQLEWKRVAFVGAIGRVSGADRRSCILNLLVRKGRWALATPVLNSRNQNANFGP